MRLLRIIRRIICFIIAACGVSHMSQNLQVSYCASSQDMKISYVPGASAGCRRLQVQLTAVLLSWCFPTVCARICKSQHKSHMGWDLYRTPESNMCVMVCMVALRSLGFAACARCPRRGLRRAPCPPKRNLEALICAPCGPPRWAPARTAAHYCTYIISG